MLFDLDGFKGYNDTFGHMAGDAMLARLGAKLARAVEDSGAAYRLGGDEFCATLRADLPDLELVICEASAALAEQGEDFAVGASWGAVLLPHGRPASTTRCSWRTSGCTLASEAGPSAPTTPGRC